MAGDADMDRDEMVARIAMLEAMVYALIEQRALQIGEGGGVDAITRFVGEMAFLVQDRTNSLNVDQKQKIAQNYDQLMRVLHARLLPKDNGETVN